MLQAAVALLAKTAHPLHPKDGRPITILASLYRLWAKCMAQKIFLAIEAALPKDLYGSVPNKETMDAAFELQSILEEAHSIAEGAVGICWTFPKPTILCRGR